jgi:hypothetical protein
MLLTLQRLQCSDHSALDELVQNEAKLATEIKSVENEGKKSNFDTGDSFYHAICESINFELEKYDNSNRGNNNSARRGTATVLQAEFQADAVLAHRGVARLSDMIISTDTDLAVLIGPNSCLVKNYSYCQKNEPMHTVQLAFSSITVPQ